MKFCWLSDAHVIAIEEGPGGEVITIEAIVDAKGGFEIVGIESHDPEQSLNSPAENVGTSL